MGGDMLRTEDLGWTPEEEKPHINTLELQAAYFGLLSGLPFARDWRDVDVLMKVDNTSTIAYIKKHGAPLI
ncbi:unnamed protein product [Cylicostephanus goldi]|uniref:RNase H type-1 domain-containing protein n=1 Tax=Cylicostephanus goldi TaxID=71465 RepID=A0A3P7NJW7_CYLGO|nr:unnamed protein product [Cylicostephanus goldi]